jgi:hypothetical protein
MRLEITHEVSYCPNIILVISSLCYRNIEFTNVLSTATKLHMMPILSWLFNRQPHSATTTVTYAMLVSNLLSRVQSEAVLMSLSV